MITKKAISEKVLEYLQHRITLREIVDWAEEILMLNKFEDDNTHTVRNILARIGSADVKAFGLTWEDCEKIMQQLGFKLQVFAKAEN
jgi:cobyrinic acid a,c-diamide synthase